MRQAFVSAMGDAMASDARVWLLSADTGFHALDGLFERFPGRCLNCGIAEAAAIGLAAGLSLAGKRPFVYGIAPFVTLRCLEQIRVDLCINRLPVTVVGIGGGLVYGPAGPTHQSIEDVAAMAALPGMTVVCPGDPAEAEAATCAVLALEGPGYLRLGKSGEPAVHKGPLPAFALGRAIRLRAGRGIGVIASGAILPVAAEAVSDLARRGLDPEFLSVHTVKPLDEAALLDAASRCSLIAAVEEHSRIGGLCSAAAALIAARAPGVRLLPLAIPDAYSAGAFSQDALRHRYGLTPAAITDAILAALR